MQRFLHEQKLVIPFTQGAGVNCRDYSILLERAVVDFGADISFGQAVEKFKEHFKYKEALTKELPIGSGEIESGNRSVVQTRLKIPGAWWKPETAKWMLALRCMRMNGDWERYWCRINPSFRRAP